MIKHSRCFHFFGLFILISVALAADFMLCATSQAADITAIIKITVCGNGIIETGEQCDAAVLGGATCSTLGYRGGGTLSCKPSCEFNVANCSSGGSGGGAVYTPPTPPQTTVNFSGRAYPKSVVTLLKDAQVAATISAGTDANFSISLNGLSAGNYIFSVYSEDSQGIRSSLLTFPVSVTAGVTTNVSGIFISPTLAVDKSEVKRGDNIIIFGQAAPQSDIIISVNSEEEFFGKTISGKDGVYLYNFDTSPVDYGIHTTKSKASMANQLISSWSYLVSFKVGTKNVVQELKKIEVKGDANNDRRVNLVDFSIAAYWYKRSSPPATADLNNDKKVDLIDFSIMAYYWTG